MPTVITRREMSDGAMLKASLVNGKRPRTCQTKPEVQALVDARLMDYRKLYAAGRPLVLPPIDWTRCGPLDEPPDDDQDDDDETRSRGNSPES